MPEETLTTAPEIDTTIIDAMDRVRRVNDGEEPSKVYAELLKYHGYEGLYAIAYSMREADHKTLARAYIAQRKTAAPVASPLKWHGGKSYLAAKIVAMMPTHTHYVEPFAGGLSVLLAKESEGVSEVVNDAHRDLTNFWEVLGLWARFLQFKRDAEAIPFSESAYRRAVIRLAKPWAAATTPASLDDVIERAVAFFVVCRQSLAGRMKGFATLSRTRTRRGMNEQASAWLTTVDGLDAVHERLRRVVILNRDALDVIRQQDGPETLFYLDPPYLHATRATTGEYAHEMTDEQHAELLTVLGQIKGRFLLSGYRSEIYDEAHAAYDWNRADFDLPNNSAGGETKRRMIECVWTNYDPAASE
jgi:DNA adenine methylase